MKTNLINFIMFWVGGIQQVCVKLCVWFWPPVVTSCSGVAIFLFLLKFSFTDWRTNSQKVKVNKSWRDRGKKEELKHEHEDHKFSFKTHRVQKKYKRNQQRDFTLQIHAKHNW